MSEARPDRFAIIPTRGNRPDTLERCLSAIRSQVDRVIILINNTVRQELGIVEPVTVDGEVDLGQYVAQGDMVIQDPETPVNLSRLWNQGLDIAYQLRKAPDWDIAILNDDAVVPPHWFEVVSRAMREHGCAAACSGGRTGRPIIHREAKPVDLLTRMQGFAFVLNGNKGARANEQLKWWFGDDHLDWLSRQLGGMVMIPGYHPEHLGENSQVTPQLQEQIARDAAAFVAYWGMRPW